jgi:hypothetical protein
MIETATSTQDIRPPRRWKQRAAAVFVILLLITIVWTIAGPSEAVRKAGQLRLGQTYAEVLAIMGNPNVTTSARPVPVVSPDNAYFGDTARAYKDGLLLLLRLKTGMNIPTSDLSKWPVHVRLDANGRVDRIKRGSEIIEAPASQTK